MYSESDVCFWMIAVWVMGGITGAYVGISCVQCKDALPVQMLELDSESDEEEQWHWYGDVRLHDK